MGKLRFSLTRNLLSIAKRPSVKLVHLLSKVCCQNVLELRVSVFIHSIMTFLSYSIFAHSVLLIMSELKYLSDHSRGCYLWIRAYKEDIFQAISVLWSSVFYSLNSSTTKTL